MILIHTLNNRYLNVASVLFAVLPSLALGQPIPSAGTILQEIQPAQRPSATPAATPLTIDQHPDAVLPPGAPFWISQLLIEGNSLFKTHKLRALVWEVEGQTMPLDRLEALLAAIPAYYKSQGYPLVRVVIPVQVVRDGIVRIKIIEGHYGNISLNNTTEVTDELLQETLDSLVTGQPVNQIPLNRVLLLLSDVPGVEAGGVLKPGDTFGTTDFQVNTVQSGPSVAGDVTLDNSGSRYTGRPRIAGTVFMINPLHHGDILSLSLLSSGSKMNYGRLSYDTLIDGKGTRLGGTLSALDYTLGEPVEALEAHGSAYTANLWINRPLLRRHDANIYGKLQLDHLQLSDRIDATYIRTDRHLDYLEASLAGDVRDNVLAGGITTWNLGASVGWLNFDDEAAQVNDAQTARTEGRYQKLTANAVRLQGLGARDTLYLSLSAQWAGSNLDASQKISAGGPNSVRAYEAGALSGDSGYTSTIEWRHELLTSGSDRWQVVAFIDAARVEINKNIWTGTVADNIATLRGIGVGLNWTAQEWSAQLHIAAPFGERPEQLDEVDSYLVSAEINRRL
jgi:hemolysin activation/secretion protein